MDCAEPTVLAAFWREVLGWQVIGEGDGEVEIASGPDSPDVWPTLLFVPVPEGKAVKNRLHLDVTPTDRTRAEEVERVLALGARHVDIGQGEQNWTVLADPEGNEFCILRSLAERNLR